MIKAGHADLPNIILNFNIRTICLNKVVYKPIFISRTEKIEVGDWVFNEDVDGIAGIGKLLRIDEFNNYIFQTPHGDEQPIDKEEVLNRYHFYKVLALPEHFSLGHLLEIIDEKLKGNQNYLLECEFIQTEVGDDEVGWDGAIDGVWCGYMVKLNTFITVHKTQDDNVYTSEDVKKKIRYALSELADNRVSEKELNRWFERNNI